MRAGVKCRRPSSSSGETMAAYNGGDDNNDGIKLFIPHENEGICEVHIVG